MGSEEIKRENHLCFTDGQFTGIFEKLFFCDFYFFSTFFADTTAVTCALNAAPHKRPYSVPSTKRKYLTQVG